MWWCNTPSHLKFNTWETGSLYISCAFEFKNHWCKSNKVCLLSSCLPCALLVQTLYTHWGKQLLPGCCAGDRSLQRCGHNSFWFPAAWSAYYSVTRRQPGAILNSSWAHGSYPDSLPFPAGVDQLVWLWTEDAVFNLHPSLSALNWVSDRKGKDSDRQPALQKNHWYQSALQSGLKHLQET